MIVLYFFPAYWYKTLQVFFLRCYTKLGEWQEGVSGLTETSIPQVINYYSEATRFDKERYKAWHAFAYANYEAVLFYKMQKSSAESGQTEGSSRSMTSIDDSRDVIFSEIVFQFLITSSVFSV